MTGEVVMLEEAAVLPAAATPLVAGFTSSAAR